MTATYTQVKDALEVVLKRLPGVNVYKFVPGQIIPPAAVVAPGTGRFLTYATSNVTHDLDLAITVFVQRGQDRSTDDLLSEFIADSGDLSVYAAVAADSTLGGVVDDSWVVAAENWGVFTFGELSYLGCVFPVQVLL